MYSSRRPENLGLEMSLHRSINPSQAAASATPAQIQQPHQIGGRPRNQNAAVSDDDGEPGEESRPRAASLWHRMKWTDNMVRLMIMLVFYVGDEAGGEGNDRKKGSGGSGVPLQKKGKWKSVSEAMTERGFNVSPQQCEDKFNDLNKRYKRVNDILGKGTACRVVEDQSLLDKMDHLSERAKEEVKKMISSKHLFFREMCAYHNSCSHGSVSEIPEISRIENDESDDEDNEEGEDEEEDVIETPLPLTKRARRVEDSLVEQMENGRWCWMKEKLQALEVEGVGIKARALEIERQRLKWLKFSTKKEMEMEKERLTNQRMELENERMALFIRQQILSLHCHNTKRDAHAPAFHDPAMEEDDE